jgi:hypothetical protein
VVRSGKEKRQRRGIGSADMSDRSYKDDSTRKVSFGTKMVGRSGNKPGTYFFKCL